MIILRRLSKEKHHQVNPLWHIYRKIKFVKVLKQTLIIEIARFVPSMKLKNKIYKKLLKMDVGNHTAFGNPMQIQLDSGGDNEWHKKKITSFQ